MEKNIVLKYDKEKSLKTGALSFKLYVFMISIFALIVLVSGAVFDVICFKNGIADVIVFKYTGIIIEFSLFLLLIWIFSMPVWYPGYVAEKSSFVKIGKDLYRVKSKKDELDDEKIINKAIKELPNNKEKNVSVEKYENYKILKKTSKYLILSAKKDGKEVKFKVFNIYSNYENI